MALAYSFVQDDTASALRVLCRAADGSVIDLTGATVELLWRDSAGALQARTMTIESPATAGNANYQFAAGELEPPRMDWSLRITDAQGKELRSLELISESVREKLG